MASDFGEDTSSSPEFRKEMHEMKVRLTVLGSVLMMCILAGCATTGGSASGGSREIALELRQIDGSVLGSERLNTIRVETSGADSQQLYGYVLYRDGLTVQVTGQTTGKTLDKMSLKEVQADYQRVIKESRLSGGSLVMREAVRGKAVCGYTANMPALNCTVRSTIDALGGSSALQVTCAADHPAAVEPAAVEATAVEPAGQNVTAVDAPKRAWEVEAKVSYWFSDISGDLRIDGNGIRGSTTDLKDDLGFDRAEMGFFEAYGRYGRHRLTVGYQDAEYSGSTNIPREIIAKGQTYPAGSLVGGNLRLQTLELEYQYDFLRLENFLSGMSLGVIGKILYVEGHTSSSAPALGLSGQGNFYAPIPMLGVGVQMGLLAHWLEFRGKVTGSTFSGNTFMGVDAALSLTPLPYMDLTCGYKYIKYDYEQDNVMLDITLSGPYVGLTIRY